MFMNEPESEEKFAKIELMQKVIDRSREVVNWWDNYEAKMIRKEKKQQRLLQAQEEQRRREEEIAKANAPYEQDWNTTCKYYCQNSYGERSCSCGMDMTFCSKRCAFATNVSGSTKAYEAPITLNYRRVKAGKENV